MQPSAFAALLPGNGACAGSRLLLIVILTCCGAVARLPPGHEKRPQRAVNVLFVRGPPPAVRVRLAGLVRVPRLHHRMVRLYLCLLAHRGSPNPTASSLRRTFSRTVLRSAMHRATHSPTSSWASSSPLSTMARPRLLTLWRVSPTRCSGVQR